MQEDALFPDGRTFSEIIGLRNQCEIDDPEDVSSGMGAFERVDDLGDEVGVFVILKVLKRSLDEIEESDIPFKKPAVSTFARRVVGESSGAVFDAIASSSKSQLPLQAWEHGVFGYICGNNDIIPMPALPKLEQPADLAPPPQVDTLDTSLVVIDKEPVFMHAVKLKACCLF